KDKISADDKEKALGRIDSYTDVREGDSEVVLVVEAVPEVLDIKKKVFAKIDESAPEKAVLASDTSSISITTLAAAASRTDRFIGMYFFNPVSMMKLVELVKSYETEKEVIDLIYSTANMLNQSPVKLADYPGFVSNRVLMT